ncbi:MAG TPA: transposase [Gaiellaceae bacterium]|jgi:REP element-mobilizing transposase RayT|nr:transposase [Gaiellaceae bacterium]
MGREPRPQIASGIYHVTARGNRRQLIFFDERDVLHFHAIASDVVARHSWVVYGYCLMPNHYHLVLRTPGPDLSIGMQRLNSSYAHWFNRRHGLDGHLFQDRFWSILVESDAHLLELCRYVALNPVRARLCAHPGAWRWSSFAEVCGRGPRALVSTRELLRYFGSEKRRAAERYREFICSA